MQAALCGGGGACGCIFCVGGCVYVVVVAVHGGFAAVTQPRIHLEERSPQECIATVLRTDSCCPMYCARIRLLSLA